MNKPTLFSTNELQEIVHNFVDELQKSANGISTSISYIRNTVPKKNLQNEVIQCMIMGGTIFEKALVLRNGKNVEILSSEKIPMPVMKDINIFTDLILQQLDSTVSKVGFCLAYPLEPVFRENILDGKLLRGTKEHNFEGLVGRNVGETLEAIIEKRTGKKISISIANDTVCLVLAGRNYETSKEIAGGINGTGTNFGFAESSEIIVNLESGNFNRFKISDACMAIDGSSNNPNKQLFEKEVSGGYLYRLFSYYHPEIHISSTEELSQIAQSADSNSETAAILLKRSAQLFACQVAGITRYKSTSMVFVIEGSVFWKSYNYQNFVEEYLHELGLQDQVEFIQIEKSSILGTAQLVI